MTPRVAVNFMSHTTCRIGLKEKEPQATYAMSTTWASYMADTMPIGQ